MKGYPMSFETERQEFAKRAAACFAKDPRKWTYTDGDIREGCLFAMRFGLGNDCVVVFRLDPEYEPVNYFYAIPDAANEAPDAP